MLKDLRRNTKSDKDADVAVIYDVAKIGDAAVKSGGNLYDTNKAVKNVEYFITPKKW